MPPNCPDHAEWNRAQDDCREHVALSGNRQHGEHHEQSHDEAFGQSPQGLCKVGVVAFERVAHSWVLFGQFRQQVRPQGVSDLATCRDRLVDIGLNIDGPAAVDPRDLGRTAADGRDRDRREWHFGSRRGANPHFLEVSQ